MAPEAPALAGRRRTWAFAVVVVAFVMDLLDLTIVNVALPGIAHALQASQAQVAWIVAGYALAFAVLLVIGGRLGDLCGHRTMFVWGVGSFTLASLACGLADSAAALVLARVAQGACAALMVPQVLTLMQAMYAPHERMRAFTVFGMLGGAASALGPVLGGVLVDADLAGLGWRVVFLINLPVGALAIAGAWRLLPRDPPAPGTALDLGGTAWCLLAALAWAVPLLEGPERGWSPALLLLLASAPLCSWALWRHCRQLEARGGQPIVLPSLLQEPGYRGGLLVSLVCTGLMPAYLFVLTLALQMGAGLSATQMSTLCLPVALGVTASITWLGKRAFARWGARCIALGTALQLAGSALMAAVCAGALGEPARVAMGWPGLLAQALLGLGVGFVGPPLTAVSLQAVPRSQAGGASGVVNAGRQFAAVGGVALVAALVPRPGPGGHSPAVLLQAMPALALMALAGAALAWRLPRLAAPDPGQTS